MLTIFRNMPTDDLLTEMNFDTIDWLKISNSDVSLNFVSSGYGNCFLE